MVKQRSRTRHDPFSSHRGAGTFAKHNAIKRRGSDAPAEPEDLVRPMANEVELRVGDTVYWDDRPGWEGRVAAIEADTGLIDVDYDNGETDRLIDPRMFSTRASYRGRTSESQRKR